jgi:hypothetical protein
LNPLVCRSLARLPRLGAIAACALFALAASVHAQNSAAFDATRLREPADLGTAWLVHGGDDPAFASPAFDDSHWTLFDPYKNLLTAFPLKHPEVVWYRLRIKVDPTQTGLALREWNISSAFEIYVNGERLIACGQVAPYVAYNPGARILGRVPGRLLAGGALLIALRVHLTPNEWNSGQFPGFYPSNLTIGQYTTLYQDDWLRILGENSLRWLDNLLLFGLGLVALVFYFAQRRQTEYLWIFALGTLSLLASILPAISVFQVTPGSWELFSSPLRLFSPYIWASLYFSFVHHRITWRGRILLALAGLTNYFSGISFLFPNLPPAIQLIGNLPFILLLSVVVPIVMAIHLRRGNREAGILFIPLMLFSLYIYARVVLAVMLQFPSSTAAAIRGLNLIDRIPVGPFLVSLDNISGILSTLSLAIIILIRSSSMSRRQAQIESELAAAQQVQQVLLPDRMESVPGFTVETVYQPAQQVGGDYFQVLPASGGGLLLVVGDVAGKGLPAAMMVSVLVGAIRATADHTCAPEELLASLNERLIGRARDGFSTALAAHISADGTVTIANAGHLSPYLDGQEIELPGALPLGILASARYQTTQFQLNPGSRLTFYSDGVVEAQNQQGELFGFDRGKAISTQPAAAIVEAAIQFGQADDITVVTIQRDWALASAAD